MQKPRHSIAGMNLSVPAFYEGQNCSGVPDHYVTRERANELKISGEARPIHRGTALLLLTMRPAALVDTHRSSVKSRWAVVGQTKKPMTDAHMLGTLDEKHSTPEKPVYRPVRIGPGFPRYALV